MNIQAIIPQIQTVKSANNKHLNNSSTGIQPKYSYTLTKDTVSFSAKYQPKTIGNTIENAIMQSYIINEPNLKARAIHFHKALKKVCERLSNIGFSYDENYNIKHPVKTLESFMDKYSRQGYVQDTVRGTAYWQDQHDIGAFKQFIEEMKLEGYEIAPIRVLNPKTLKFEKFPDLEIRQNGISKEDLALLGTFMQKAEISKPRSSTYSDFQMRFVSTGGAGKSENKQPIELIMLYGPHYANAKELESKYVYNIARSFDKLHIDLHSKYPEKSPARRIANNVDVIKTRLREDISRPLFTNAYNQDLKIKGEEKLPVMISKAHCEVLDGYMSGIRQKIPMYYREIKAKLKDDNYVIQIIKNSNEYISRENKEISSQEIKAMREFLKNQLLNYEAEDLGTITTAHELLKATIKKFGEK